MSDDGFKQARDSLRTANNLLLEGVLVAVDFDSTCVFHEYPAIGPAIPGAIDTLKDLQRLGAKLILHTMRGGIELRAAVIWLQDRGIELWGINHNPTQWRYSTSRKIFADIYIDDCAIGIPLKHQEGYPPYVDWEKVRPLLEQRLGIKL